MKIALLDAFPAAPFMAEKEFIARCIYVLRKLGHEAMSVATSIDINNFDPDVVIASHELSAKLTDHFTMGPLWSPTQFYKDDETCLRSMMSWDIIVPMDPMTRQFAIDLHYPTRHSSAVSKHVLFPSAPVIEIAEPDLKKISLCYIGVHWDGVRHERFFTELAKAVDLHVYGPREPWEFLSEAYRGSVPFDGRSIFEILNKHGAVLALHKKSHCEEDTPSMRTFEACAAKCFVITDAMPSLRTLFGSNFSYLDWNETVEHRVSSVKKTLESIKADPNAALQRIRGAHRIFESSLSLDALLPPILLEAQARKSHQILPRDNSDPEITVIVRCEGRPLKVLASAIETVSRQTYKNIGIVLAGCGNVDGLDVLKEEIASTGRFRFIEKVEVPGSATRSSTLWVGMQAVKSPFFATIEENNEWFSSHLSDIMEIFKSDKNADVVHSGGIWHNEDGQSINLHKRLQRSDHSWLHEPRLLEAMTPSDTAQLLQWAKTILPHSFVAKTSLLDPVVLDDPNLDVMEDVYLYLLWVSRGANFVFNGHASAIRNFQPSAAENSVTADSRQTWGKSTERIARRLRRFNFPGEYLGKEVLSKGYPDSTKVSPNDCIGKPIDFSSVQTPRCFAWVDGLSWGEPWGRWTDQDITTLVFRFPLPTRFILEISGKPSGSMFRRNIKVEIDNHFTEFRMSKGKLHTYKILMTNKSEANTIRLHFSNAKSPADLKGDPKLDDRKLGIALSTIRVNPHVTLLRGILESSPLRTRISSRK